MKKRIKRFVKDKKHRFKVIDRRGVYNRLDDIKYLSKKKIPEMTDTPILRRSISLFPTIRKATLLFWR